MSQTKNLVLQELHLPSGTTWQMSAPGILFAFIKQGRGSYLGKGHQQVLSAGDVLVTDCSSVGTWSVVGAVDLSIKYFHVWLDSLVPFLNTTELCHLEKLNTKQCSLLCHFASTPIARQCHDLIDSVSAGVSLEHRTQLLRVISLLFSECLLSSDGPDLSQDPPHSRMLESLSNLTAEDIQNLSVTELSQKCGCCRRHLNRLFQERFGTSVAALKMELRLLKAAALLRDPSAKIINVAMETGFNHLGLFSNYFKRRFGANPSEWRRKELPVAAVTLAPMPSKAATISTQLIACQFQLLGLCPIPNNHANKPEAAPAPRN